MTTVTAAHVKHIVGVCVESDKLLIRCVHLRLHCIYSDSGFCKSLHRSVISTFLKLIAMAEEELAIVPVEPKSVCAERKLPSPIPMPTFELYDGYTSKSKVQCFWCDENGRCPTVRSGCLSLWNHVMGYHTNYKIPPEWKGTPLQKQAYAEKSQLRAARKAKDGASANKKQGETDGGKTDDAVQAIVECSQESGEPTFVPMPGSSATIWLPPGVGANLVASGYLRVTDNGNAEWNPKIKARRLQNQILELMPQGQQRDHLKKKFETDKASSTQALQPKQIVSRTSDTSHQTSLDNFFGEGGTSMDVFIEAQRQMLGEIRNCVKAVTANEPKAAPQALKLKDNFKDWKKPEGWDEAKRNNFPFPDEEIPDEDLVSAFDAFMESNMLKEDSRKKYQTGLARFCMMFETTDGSPVDYKNILLNVCRSQLFDKVQSLEIMAPDYSCTMVIVFL